ncbi:urease accessory protein UreF [uncultured Corynebacterium sp.]|uniref:urease accessory protein UreF n=1 Tax=uncultured Corynebacterium sp. TaxID=159447 RepID=UPI0025FF2B6C|nr:urease accessory UreF family protein [uncultured Corynebacterium sp.]
MSSAPPSLLPFLQAMTYADSAYPSGRYTLSHGLEGLVQAHRVRGAAQVREALLDHLRHTAAPGDGVATAVAALVAANADLGTLDTLVTVDHELSATKVTHELRRASTRVGRQMLQVTADVEARLGQVPPQPLASYASAVAAKETPGNQAVVAGLVHASHGLTAAEAVATELTGLAVGWAGAALRLRQCDHIDAQVVITAAHPVVAELAVQCTAVASDLLASSRGSAGAPADPTVWRLLGRASPGSDLASAAHETAPARLFMS